MYEVQTNQPWRFEDFDSVNGEEYNDRDEVDFGRRWRRNREEAEKKRSGGFNQSKNGVEVWAIVMQGENKEKTLKEDPAVEDVGGAIRA